MKLSELVAQYVSHKRALGMRFNSEAATLASFCHRVDGNIDVESVTVEQVQDFLGYFKSGVGNAAYEACGLNAEKSSLPAMRNSTVRMVLKLAYPRALRLAA
jgi:hypothetical protein